MRYSVEYTQDDLERDLKVILKARDDGIYNAFEAWFHIERACMRFQEEQGKE